MYKTLNISDNRIFNIESLVFIMRKLFLNEKAMLCVVILNVLVIFLQGCGMENVAMSIIDTLCTLIFVVEMVVKHREYGFKGYWRDGWNILDGSVTLLTLPAVLV